jgi:transketolase
MAINGGANVKVVGSHSGITLAADGPSQMGLSDIAFQVALDDEATTAAIRAATSSSPRMHTRPTP